LFDQTEKTWYIDPYRTRLYAMWAATMKTA